MRPLTPEEFVRIWQAAPNVSEVSRQAGMDRQSCSNLACRMRRHGVPLKIMNRGGKYILFDYATLATLARKVAKDGH